MITANKYVPGTFDRANLAKIPCPNLRTLVNEGLITPDPSGVVELTQLDSALRYIGVVGAPKKILVGGAEKATAEAIAQQFGGAVNGKFNIYKLAGSNLDHVGDTRILRNGFNPDRLEWLLSFANADGRIGIKELSGAQVETRRDEKADFRASALGIAELTALCLVYGTIDKNGDRSISAEGVRDLYEHSRFPAEWKAARGDHEVGLLALLGGVGEMVTRQLFGAVGRSHAGVEAATRGDKTAAKCPFHGLFKRD